LSSSPERPKSGEMSHLLHIIRPTLPDMEDFRATVQESYASGSVTVGKVVALFEQELTSFCHADHAVTVSNCTSGLMLALAAMGFPAAAEVVVPSFTFAATVQAVHWNGLTPVYVDCLPSTMTIDPGEVRKALGLRTVAIMPVTTYGVPPDLEELEEISQRYSIPLISDSAQGLGSTYKTRPAGGFGLCEVFSLSPTKVITAIEGGVVTTNDRGLARKLRSMRDYGKGPDGEDMILNGLSARMSELHAAVGLLSLRNAEYLVHSRLALIRRYRELTQALPGCRVQEFPPDRTSSGNYFTLLIGEGARTDRDEVFRALKERQIQSKRYFFPPVHSQTAFRHRPHRVVGSLPNTWAGSLQSLALPLYSHMTEAEQDRVIDALNAVLA
jgi:dTDP-4-amino-4,6-dideoxygalactose transaminase